MWYPTAELLVAVHDELIRRTGGATGVLHRGALDGVLHRAEWGPFEREGDLSERAIIIRGIALDHPSVDGNKRPAFEATDLFLTRNGAYIATRTEDVVGFMLEVARGEHDLQNIASWIRSRLRQV